MAYSKKSTLLLCITLLVVAVAVVNLDRLSQAPGAQGKQNSRSQPGKFLAAWHPPTADESELFFSEQDGIKYPAAVAAPSKRRGSAGTSFPWPPPSKWAVAGIKPVVKSGEQRALRHPPSAGVPSEGHEIPDTSFLEGLPSKLTVAGVNPLVKSGEPMMLEHPPINASPSQISDTGDPDFSWRPASMLSVTGRMSEVKNWRLLSVNERVEEEMTKAARHLRKVLMLIDARNRNKLSSREVSARNEVVVYNRVGKCASRTMLWLIAQLAYRNGFVAAGSPIGNETNPPSLRQDAIRKLVAQLPAPALYQRHLHYIELDESGSTRKKPVLINVVRHPLERAVSQYYFKRFGDNQKGKIRGRIPKGTQNETFDTCIERQRPECYNNQWYIVPFFCGTAQVCRKPSRTALEIAKSRVEDEYLFVGLSEYFPETVKAFEKLLPGLFSGATDILKKQHSDLDSKSKSTSTRKKIPPSHETRAKLLPLLTLELEFFHFVETKFIKKLKQLKIPIRKLT